MTISERVASYEPSMLKALKALVQRESPTSNKTAVDACLSYFVKQLAELGGSVLQFPQKDIGDLYAVEFAPPGRDARRKPILVLTHCDTVWPLGTLKARPFRRSGDKVFGPGALDMKAGMVEAWFALKSLWSLRRFPARPVVVLIDSTEERRHPAAERFIRQWAKRSAYILCLEPAIPGGALKVQRKGRLGVRIWARGRSAHGSSPEKGVNAIEELMGQLRILRRLRRGGTTLNIGRVEGGQADNVVAEDAWAVLDIRFWSQTDRRRVLSILESLSPLTPGARVGCRILGSLPPMEQSQASRSLFRRARGVASRLDLELKAGKTGGGSDASLVTSLGIPILDGLGPDGDGIHAAHEHVLLSSLIQRTTLLASLLLEL